MPFDSPRKRGTREYQSTRLLRSKCGALNKTKGAHLLFFPRAQSAFHFAAGGTVRNSFSITVFSFRRAQSTESISTSDFLLSSKAKIVWLLCWWLEGVMSEKEHHYRFLTPLRDGIPAGGNLWILSNFILFEMNKRNYYWSRWDAEESAESK